MRPLEGYGRQPGRREGGITRIALAAVTAVESVRYDRATGNAEGIEPAGGEVFALYRFREDTAHYTETTATQAGFTTFEREISFCLERLDAPQRESIARLIGASPHGIAAIVWNGCGTAYLIGLGRYPGASTPLRVDRTETLPGGSPADVPGTVVTLRCQDTEPAPLFTGEVPLMNNEK